MKKCKNKLPKYAGGTSIVNYLEDPTEVLAKNKINIAKAEFEAETNPLIQGLNMLAGITPQLLPKLGKGGKVNNVPVEVEGGEMGQLPNGKVMEFKGPTHENGGIPISLPEGTDIYSDRITIDGKTMAERKKERESIAAKYKKKADAGDALAKNALQRILVFNTKQDEIDRRIQDTLNTSNQRQSFGKGTKLTGITYTPPTGNEPENLYTVDELYNDPIKGLIPRTVNKTEVELLGPSKIFNNSVKNTTLKDAAAIIGETLPTYEKVPSYLPKSENPAIKSKNFTDIITGGDILNIAGNAFSGVAPYLNTLENRATDTPNVNAYKNYGKEGLQKLSESETYLRQLTDEALKTLETSRESITSSNRNSARGVNTKRALDLAAYSDINKRQSNVYGNFAQNMMNLISQEAQMKNQQDQIVMQGEQARDLADRADKDAFYTAKGQGLANIGATTAMVGKQFNDMMERDSTMDLYNNMYNLLNCDKLKQNF